MNGQKREAENHLQKKLEYDQEAIELGHPKSRNQRPYLESAFVYAFYGEKKEQWGIFAFSIADGS
jgi:hypothetical protein